MKFGEEPQLNNDEADETRRKVLKGAVAFGAIAAAGLTAGCKIEDGEQEELHIHESPVLQDTLRRFEEEGLDHSKQYHAFVKIYTEENYKKFLTESSLSEEEFNDNWNASIQKRTLEWLRRAREDRRRQDSANGIEGKLYPQSESSIPSRPVLESTDGDFGY